MVGVAFYTAIMESDDGLVGMDEMARNVLTVMAIYGSTLYFLGLLICSCFFRGSRQGPGLYLIWL